MAGDLGFVPAGHLPLMCAHAGDVVRAEGGHATTRVTDVEGVLAAGDILADAFELPGGLVPAAARRRVRRRGPTPRPSSPCTTAGRSPWPAARGSATSPASTRVGTRQSHRRRGAAAAAVSAAIEHEMQAGARWFGLLSSPAAEPFYAGLGFVAVDHASAWVLEGA